MVIYFVENDDFIMFFTIFQRWESPFFQKLQLAVGKTRRVIGTGSDPLDAGSGRSIGLSVEQEGSDPSGDPQKKKVKISDSLGGSTLW